MRTFERSNSYVVSSPEAQRSTELSFHIDKPLVACILLALGLWLFSAFEDEIVEAVLRMKRRMKGRLRRRWSRRTRTRAGLAFKRPRYPTHMRIIRHPDGQRETLALFERD